VPSLAWSLPKALAAALFLVIASPAPALEDGDGAHPDAPSATAGVREEAHRPTSTALVPIEHAFEAFSKVVAIDEALRGRLMPAVTSATSVTELEVAVAPLDALVQVDQVEGQDCVKIFGDWIFRLHYQITKPISLGYTSEIPPDSSALRYVKGFVVGASNYDTAVAWLQASAGADRHPEALRVVPSLGVVVITDTATRLREWERGVRERSR